MLKENFKVTIGQVWESPSLVRVVMEFIESSVADMIIITEVLDQRTRLHVKYEAFTATDFRDYIRVFEYKLVEHTTPTYIEVEDLGDVNDIKENSTSATTPKYLEDIKEVDLLDLTKKYLGE